MLRDFRDLAPTLPDEVSPVAVLSPVPDDEAFPASIRGGDALFILAMAAAPLEEGPQLVRPIAALGYGAAVDIGGPTPYVEFQQFFDADYPAHTMRYYWKSSFADDLADGLIDRLVEAFQRRPSHHSTIDIWANLAARSRASPATTARSASATAAVADQPGVELGIGGGRRGEPRLGPRHRRRRSAAAPT